MQQFKNNNLSYEVIIISNSGQLVPNADKASDIKAFSLSEWFYFERYSFKNAGILESSIFGKLERFTILFHIIIIRE